MFNFFKSKEKIEENTKFKIIVPESSQSGEEDLRSFENKGAISIKTTLRNNDLINIYDLFDRCVNEIDDLYPLLEKWENEFSRSKESLECWNSVRFGMRDKRPKERTKDRKYYLQFSREYYQWILDNNKKELESRPTLLRLFNSLMHVDHLAEKIYKEKINSIIPDDSNRQKLFYTYRQEKRIPISIRLIAYECSGTFNTRAHYDKAAFGLLFPSDDNPNDECLLISPTKKTSFNLSDLKQVVRNQEENSCSHAIMIPGSLLKPIGIDIAPTAHLVLPHDRPLRDVLVAFCNIPNLSNDLAKKDFNLLSKEQIQPEFINKFRTNNKKIIYSKSNTKNNSYFSGSACQIM